jgi:hypothetical protein
LNGLEERKRERERAGREREEKREEGVQCRLKPSPTWGAMLERRKVSSIAAWSNHKVPEPKPKHVNPSELTDPRRDVNLPQRDHDPVDRSQDGTHLWSLRISRWDHVTSVVPALKVVFELRTPLFRDRGVFFEPRAVAGDFGGVIAVTTGQGGEEGGGLEGGEG